VKNIKTKPINYAILDLHKASFHHTTFEPINFQQTTQHPHPQNKKQTHQLTRLLSFSAFGNLIHFSLSLHPNDACCTSFHPTQ